VFASRTDCDLRDYQSTLSYFQSIKPTHVVHLAARVGGLFANMRDKVGFFEDNLTINMNVVRACHSGGVQHMVSALSTCVFPDGKADVLSESML
jgi:GDP-L-fucose synthase